MAYDPNNPAYMPPTAARTARSFRSAGRRPPSPTRQRSCPPGRRSTPIRCFSTGRQRYAQLGPYHRDVHGHQERRRHRRGPHHDGDRHDQRPACGSTAALIADRRPVGPGQRHARPYRSRRPTRTWATRSRSPSPACPRSAHSPTTAMAPAASSSRQGWPTRANYTITVQATDDGKDGLTDPRSDAGELRAGRRGGQRAAAPRLHRRQGRGHRQPFQLTTPCHRPRPAAPELHGDGPAGGRDPHARRASTARPAQLGPDRRRRRRLRRHLRGHQHRQRQPRAGGYRTSRRSTWLCATPTRLRCCRIPAPDGRGGPDADRRALGDRPRRRPADLLRHQSAPRLDASTRPMAS